MAAFCWSGFEGRRVCGFLRPGVLITVRLPQPAVQDFCSCIMNLDLSCGDGALIVAEVTARFKWFTVFRDDFQ